MVSRIICTGNGGPDVLLHPPCDQGGQDGSFAGRNPTCMPWPYYLVEDMDEGPLKTKPQSCRDQSIEKTDFSIVHRGGATFTKDEELVCRYDQCDLATTTNILDIPELAAKCSEPFTPYDPATGKAASAKCCTSDLTLAEFKSLCGKMDASDPQAMTPAEFMGGTAHWRTDLYATCGTLLTHKESIDLIDSLGLKFTPELKTPAVKMPFNGTFTQEKFAQKMIDDWAGTVSYNANCMGLK